MKDTIDILFERITPNTLTKLHSPSISLSNFMFMESTRAMDTLVVGWNTISFILIYFKIVLTHPIIDFRQTILNFYFCLTFSEVKLVYICVSSAYICTDKACLAAFFSRSFV